MRTHLTEMNFITNLNIEMEKLFVAVTVASLATMLLSASAHASDLAFDAAGNLFWADGPSVFKYTRDGTKSTFAAGLKGPLGLCFDSKGDLFVSDVGSHSILKFTPDGKKSTFASGLKPYEMAVDGAGNLFVSDLGSHSIFKFTPEGKKSTFATGLACYDGLAFDNSGNLFVCDNVENSIFKFTPEGTKSTFASGLSSPWGLAVDGAGNLFVRTGNTIFKFTPDGTKSTFAWMQVSPDNQWEYQCSDDGERAGIVKAGTTETVLDLSEDLPNAALLWAPDSKRFAVNSRTGHSHTTALWTVARRQMGGVALTRGRDEQTHRARGIGPIAQDALAEGRFAKASWERRRSA